MRRIRVITALILALLWVPSTGLCLLAATFPEVFGVCCECDADRTNGNDAPADEGACNQCLTLESGVALGALAPVVAPSPVISEEDALTRWLRRSIEMVALEVAGVPRPVPV